MEIVVQKIERQEIHLAFFQDAEENIEDVSPLVTSLAKLKKIINKPGFKNDFDKTLQYIENLLSLEDKEKLTSYTQNIDKEISKLSLNLLGTKTIPPKGY